MVDVTRVDDQRHHGTRWVCDRGHAPVLLAIYDRSGRIEVKVGARRYVARGRLQAICPRCGARHVLEVSRPPPAG